MREKPPRELISAYFDGELTPAEMLEAERLLERDPAARRLLEELESLRGGLSDLPPARLPVDFSQRVLKEAERRMLKSTAPTPDKPAANAADVGASPLSWIGIGLALAVAASLLLAFILPGKLGEELADRVPLAARDDALPVAAPEDAAPVTRTPPPRTSDRFVRNGAADFDADGSMAAGVDGGEPEIEALGGRRTAGGFADKAMSDRRQSEAASKMPAADSPESSAAGQPAPQQLPTDPRAVDELSTALSELTNSYVLDVPSEVAQNRVLQRFERVLSEQQITLEDNGTIAAAEEKGEVADNESAQTKLQTVKELEKSPRADESAQNVDRVYVIDATPEQLSNTIVGLNRLAEQSETPVRLRRLGTVDNMNAQTFYSTAGGMPGAGGALGEPLQAGGIAAGVPVSGPVPVTGGSGQARQSADERGSDLAARKVAEPAAGAEAAKKLARQEAGPLRPQLAPAPQREARQPQHVTTNGTAPPGIEQKAAQSAGRSNLANLGDEAQQRAIFIFRVVPTQSAANPAAPAPSQSPPAVPALAPQPARQ